MAGAAAALEVPVRLEKEPGPEAGEAGQPAGGSSPPSAAWSAAKGQLGRA